MATATTKRPATSTTRPAKKVAKRPARKASAKRPSARGRGSQAAPSLADAVRDVEHAITEDLHRELEAARKLLEGVGQDLRDISHRIESTIQELARREGSAPRARRTTAERGAAKRSSTTKKRAPAKRSTPKRAAAK
jgi:hypothetical protein